MNKQKTNELYEVIYNIGKVTVIREIELCIFQNVCLFLTLYFRLYFYIIAQVIKSDKPGFRAPP